MSIVRTFDEEMKYLERLNDYSWKIKKGFVPNMNVEGIFYVNSHLQDLMFEELRNSCRSGAVGGFLPGMKQIANVAALPGIVGVIINFFYFFRIFFPIKRQVYDVPFTKL